MGYQNAPATITITTGGDTVDFRINYDRKIVAVYVAGVWIGDYRNHTEAKRKLNLIEVPAKGRK